MDRKKVENHLAKKYLQLLKMPFSEIVSLIEFCIALSIQNEDSFITNSEFLLQHKKEIEKKLKNFRILSVDESEYNLLDQPKEEKFEAM